MAASAVEQLADAARQAGVTISQTLHRARTVGDPVLLERCAVNLIENAIKYNTAYGHVWVRTGETEGQTWLQVENTGSPISPEQAQNIFEPFRRLQPVESAPPAERASACRSYRRSCTPTTAPSRPTPGMPGVS